MRGTPSLPIETCGSSPSHVKRRRPGSFKGAAFAASIQPTALPDEVGDDIESDAGAHVRKDIGSDASHPLRVGLHHAQVRAHERRKIDLVDDQQIRARDARPALARDFSPAPRRYIDRDVGEFRVLNVAARLSPPDSMRMRSSDGKRARICATAWRLMEQSSRMAVCGHPPVSTPMMRSSGQCARHCQQTRIFLGVDVVGDGADVIDIAKALAELAPSAPSFRRPQVRHAHARKDHC